MTLLPAPSWSSWYHAKFLHAFATKTGTNFEDFIDSLLLAHHVDYLNPTPKGSLGDGGCDGITTDGRIFYAMFGYLPNRGEAKLAAKIRSDFTRAVEKWSSFTSWNFITNVGVGPEATKAFLELQGKHHPDSDRPIRLRSLDGQTLWNEIVTHLEPGTLNQIFPGVPHAANVELSDILPLLDSLVSSGEEMTDDGAPIQPVPLEKMQFNALPATAQFEFQSGRIQANRIRRWYDSNSDPLLRDTHGSKFKDLYQQARLVGGNVLEQLYIFLGGTDFRLDNIRANAVYAITTYFFDECDIFEATPQDVT